jgi:putative CocE/NonD family hydrolase
VTRSHAGFLALALTAASPAKAQENLSAKDYKVTENMVPMRDGIKLHTLFVAPTHSAKPLPFIIQRSPYGFEGFSPSNIRPSALKEGYIYILQDIRGRFKSEGKFVMMRPTASKSHAKVDEATDAYDTLDWALKNIPNNNGRAAMMGTSYLGWTTLEAAVAPHPALKFVAPAASPMDMFLNDDFHRNGAFRLSYGFEYCYMMETSKENEQFKFDLPNTYDWYLRLGALSHVNDKYFHGKVPTWNAFVAHPTHDSYWTDQSVASLLTTPRLPILSVAGFWDQEDPWGPQETFRLLARHDPNHWNHILIGPWNHGGWTGRSLGAIDFGPEAATRYTKVLDSALVYYLKGRGTPDLPAAQVFVSGENKWRSFNQWPPKESEVRELYLTRDQGLSFTPEESQRPWEKRYISDPAHPVPYRKEPIEATYDPKGSGWYTWQAQDQRFLAGRKDLVTFSTPPLTKSVTAIGNLKANLIAASSGTDCDWVVKLIDEYPNDGSKLAGYQLPINMEVIRARFRKGLKDPTPVSPESPHPYEIDLHTIAHTFLPGHRIVVQIQSSWFPLIDRNPQTFLPNIYKAQDSDFHRATQGIVQGSLIELPVIKGSPGP